MTEDSLELFYFREGEIDNPQSLEDVMRGMGSEVDFTSPLKYLMDTYVENSGIEYEEVLEEQKYKLEDGSDAAMFETDQGIFIVSHSDYISENSSSIPSRSTKSYLKQK